MIFRYIDSAHTIAQYANDDGGNAESFPSDHPRFAEVVAQGLAVAAYTPPAITWADIRSKRDGLLAATDWWAVSDRAMSASRGGIPTSSCVTYPRLSQAQQT
jgi:hypothetical protein